MDLFPTINIFFIKPFTSIVWIPSKQWVQSSYSRIDVTASNNIYLHAINVVNSISQTSKTFLVIDQTLFEC